MKRAKRDAKQVELHNKAREVEEILDHRVNSGVLQFKVKLPKDVHSVEEIVSERKTSEGLEFRVKWKGYNIMSWEPEESIIGCQKTMGDFIMKRYSKYIKKVVVSANDVLKESDIEKTCDSYEEVWVNSSELNCVSRIAEFYFKGNCEFIVNAVIGPVEKLGDEIIFLVKYKTGSCENHDFLPASILKERFPEKLIEYLEKHMIFSGYNKSAIKDESEDVSQNIKSGNRTKEYVVEKILNKYVKPDGTVMYELKWEDEKDEDNKVIKKYKTSWGSLKDLGNCYELMYEFELSYCVGLKNRFQLNQVKDIKKNVDEQVYVEVEWKTEHGTVVLETEYVLYEIIKKKFIHHLIDYFLKSMELTSCD